MSDTEATAAILTEQTARADQAANVLTGPSDLSTAPITPAVALDQWVDTHIRNSDYSRDTACWNRIHNAVVSIQDALATIDSKEA